MKCKDSTYVLLLYSQLIAATKKDSLQRPICIEVSKRKLQKKVQHATSPHILSGTNSCTKLPNSLPQSDHLSSPTLLPPFRIPQTRFTTAKRTSFRQHHKDSDDMFYLLCSQACCSQLQTEDEKTLALQTLCQQPSTTNAMGNRCFDRRRLKSV